MKLAVSGKGGVGKTTFSSLLARTLSDRGKTVLAIDADPDANLAAALGVTDGESVKPIAEMKEMIFERTGAQPGTIGGFFKLNPKVDDIPDTLSVQLDNIKLMRLGSVKKGGGGCLCPESTLLKALVTHVVLGRDEMVIMDMEAGIEHLGRATAQAVDKLIVVVEPGRRSMDTANHIRQLAGDIGVTKVLIVGSKTRGPEDRKFLRDALNGFDFLGFIDYDQDIIACDMKGVCPADSAEKARVEADKMAQRLLDMAEKD